MPELMVIPMQKFDAINVWYFEEYDKYRHISITSQLPVFRNFSDQGSVLSLVRITKYSTSNSDPCPDLDKQRMFLHQSPNN